MFEKLKIIFEELGLDYVRQGSYAENALIPNSYFSYWNTDSPLETFYDNKHNRVVWEWNIYFYTNDPNILYSKMNEFVTLAKAAGFIIQDRGSDIPSDLPGYFGRMTTVTYVENEVI